SSSLSAPAYEVSFGHLYTLGLCNFPALVKTQKNVDNYDRNKAKHVNFILAVAPINLPTKVSCPHCHQKTVKYFSLKDDKLTACCDNPKCRQRCQCGTDELFPFSLETFNHSKFKNRSQELALFFKSCFGFNNNLRAEEVYNFFKKSCCSN
ncbi:MAG: hypothetical protein Athens071426_680, partial [Parcubacteria group bacterium Athens0714_26]